MSDPISITVQALLGSGDIREIVQDRIEPEEAPQDGKLPDIVVNSVDDKDEYLLQGSAEYPRARVQIQCRAKQHSEALALRRLVIARLKNLRGTFAGAHATFFKLDTDTGDAAQDWSVYRRILDFEVRYRNVA